jgi:hypothetical protein
VSALSSDNWVLIEDKASGTQLIQLHTRAVTNS